MEGKRLLAIGIPTFKRPKSAIISIKNALSHKTYDQIIVASNSFEPELIEFIKEQSHPSITFFQQDGNVGIAKNVQKIISLCKCKYLHIVSDEDLTSRRNTRNLYKFLEKPFQYSIILTSIKGPDGNLYRDFSRKRNKYLSRLMGEVSHIGSSVINVNVWTERSFEFLDGYCRKEGNLRIANAVAIISCASGYEIAYFPEHIVEMGPTHKEGEIRGYFVYGFPSLLKQFLLILDLVLKLRLKRKFSIIFEILYYFSHHALQDSNRKFHENALKVLNRLPKKYLSKSLVLFLYVLIFMYFGFKIYFQLRSKLSGIFKKIEL